MRIKLSRREEYALLHTQHCTEYFNDRTSHVLPQTQDFQRRLLGAFTVIEYSGDSQNLMFLLTWSTFPTNLLDFCLFEKSLIVKRIKRSEYSKMPRKSAYSKLVYHHRFHCLVLNIVITTSKLELEFTL